MSRRAALASVVEGVVHTNGIITIDEILEKKTTNVCAGRRPLANTVVETNRPSSWCSAVARLEALSVIVFIQMRRELMALDAPSGLIDRATAAIADELRHAQLLGSLAETRDGIAPCVVGQVGERRGALALAEDNVVEGCVREAWGALVATWQSVHAATPELRALFASVARDETEHAALSVDVHTWLSSSFDADTNAALARSRRAAFDALSADIDIDTEAEGDDADLGLPSSSARRMLFDQFVSAWA